MPVSREMTNGPANGVRDGAPGYGALRDDTLIDCNIAELYYGQFKAVRDVALKIKEGHDHRFHRPFRMRQEYALALPQPDERSGSRVSPQGTRDLPRPEHLRLES